MIRPIFSEPETLLDRCVFSQNQHTFVPAQLRIRRNAHIEFSVFFQRKNVDVILFSDIDLTDRAIHPFRRNGHFHDGVVVTIKLCYTVGKAGDFYESERPTH